MQNKYKIKNFIYFSFIILYIYKFYYKNEYPQDDVTIVSAYYKMKSKHRIEEYFTWIRNFALLNKSLVFFSNKEFMPTFKEFMPTFKEFRPKELYYKTVFIELEMEDFYVYKNFYNEFQETFKIVHENKNKIFLFLIQ